MMKYKLFFSFLLSVSVSAAADAQSVMACDYQQDSLAVQCCRECAEKTDSLYHWGVSTNLGKWAFLGTMNVSLHFPLSDEWSAEAQARYNPWTFNDDSVDRRITWRERTLKAGVRYSFDGCFKPGFFIGLGPEWIQFNRGGVFGKQTYEGSAMGGYLKVGYLTEISEHLKFEAGLGAFAGYAAYDVWRCTVCGKKVDSGKGFRCGPDEIILSFVYVF